MNEAIEDAEKKKETGVIDDRTVRKKRIEKKENGG